MTTAIAVCYAIGYTLTLGGFLAVAPITRRALRRLEGDKAKMAAFKREHGPTVGQTGSPWATHEEFEATLTQMRRDLLLPATSAMGSGDQTKTMEVIIMRIGKANIPPAIIALAGGLISTTASILSLYQ